ncbi:unnamed protein product [Laminaria digitata]
MEITHSKGVLYPALRLSSFRVRRDSMPPAFTLPEEVTRAVEEPLPKLRSVALEEKALSANLKLLEQGERERKATAATIAKEDGLARMEAAKLAKESERKSFNLTAEKAKKVRDLMSLMGVSDTAAAEARLEQCGWDYEKAVSSFLDGA